MIMLSLLFYCSLFSVCENARVKSSAFVCACVVSCLSFKCFVKENQSKMCKNDRYRAQNIHFRRRH